MEAEHEVLTAMHVRVLVVPDVHANALAGRLGLGHVCLRADAVDGGTSARGARLAKLELAPRLRCVGAVGSVTYALEVAVVERVVYKLVQVGDIVVVVPKHHAAASGGIDALVRYHHHADIQKRDVARRVIHIWTQK